MADVATDLDTGAETRSRAVVRFVEPGSMVTCAACGAPVKFSARAKVKQVICNVYEDDRWTCVQHYHLDCYDIAGEPHGAADSSQPLRQKRRAGSSAA